MTQKDQLEQDARIALLSHYSSKSTNQTIIILTIALVSFSFVGVISSENLLKDYLLIAGFGTFFYIGLRAVGRLIIWGELGTAVVHVNLIGKTEANRELESLSQKLKLSKYAEKDSPTSLVKLSPTNLVRLSSACEVYLQARKNAENKSVRAVALFCSFTQTKVWMVMVFGSTIWLLIIKFISTFC